MLFANDPDVVEERGQFEMTGVSERTIRYYQAEKLLAKPAKRGRDGMYSDEHVERLRLIIELRDRGLTLQTIGELLRNANPARTVAAWLGVDATLSAPWSDDRPAILTQDQVAALVAGVGVGVLGELQEARYIRRNPNGAARSGVAPLGRYGPSPGK